MSYTTPTITERNSVTEILLDIIRLGIAAGGGLATEAKQDAGNTVLSNILAKLIAAPATEAKQDAANTLLTALSDKFYSDKGSEWLSVIENITDSTTRDLYPAQGAGIRSYITSILVTNKHASVGTVVQIKGNGTIWSGYAAPNGGGFSCSFPTPLKANSANYAIQCQCGTTGADVYVSVSGFKQ